MPSVPLVSVLRRLIPAFVGGLLLWASSAYATISIPLQMQMGNPSAAVATPGNPADPTNHAHYLIQRAQYALDYNDTTRDPNWVAWDLTAGDLGGSGRSNFIVDTNLPAGFYQVLTTDYSGSGYDRGHMCPSADRTVTATDNQVVFYMSNMVPQAPDNNQGVWASFETYSRSLATAGNELLIISGPSGFAGSTIASGVAIPGYVWKIVVVVPVGAGTAASRITAATRVIAIKIPNIQGVRNNPWQNYITTAAQIETDTGYTFFTDLAAGIAAALRVKLDGQTATGAPTITTQPIAQTAAVNGSANFSVTATGDPTLTYQWLKDDVEISGALSATLALANVQAADAGIYTVIVTNGVGSVTSSGAALVITGLPPTITSQPPARTASAGSTVTFSVAASGSPTLTYQWRKGGVALANGATIAGATAATLTLSNVQSGDAGTYDVVVSNGNLPNATSNGALLTVNPAAPAITSQPSPQTVAVGGTAAFSVTAIGSATLAYQWRKGGVALANGASGNGSTFAGVTTATLTLTTAQLLDTGSFDVVVSNGVLPNATSTAVALTVSAGGTPSNVTWNFGAGVGTETAAPTGGLPSDVTGGTVTQGNNNGTVTLVTATSASSTYTGFTAGNNAAAAARAGALSTAAAGSAYFEFTLTPAAGKQLIVTALAFGSRSTSTGPQAFSIFSSADNFAATIATGTLLNTSVWALQSPALTSVTGATGTAVTFRLYGHSGTGSPSASTANWRIDDLKVTLSTATAAATAPAVASTVPAASATGVLSTSPVTITFNQAVTLAGSWFSINSALNGSVSATVTGGPTAFTLTPPANFSDNDTITVTVFASQVTEQATGTLHPAANTTFSFTTASPVAPSIATPPAPQTVAAGGAATFTVVPGGTAPFSYQWRKGGVAIAGNASATTATLTLANVQSADTASYDVVVSNGVGSPATSTAALLTVTPAAPTITTQPLPQTVSVGANATFTVVATGTAPFTYQWRKGGVAIAGNASATTATLTLPAVSVGDAVNYDVVVSNGVNPAATSNSIALTVSTAVLSTVAWDFTTADPTGGLPSDVTGGTVTQGNNNGTTTLVTNVSASSGYTGFTGANNAGAAARVGALNQAASGSAYFEFTLTPAAGRKLVASAISFGTRSTGTGPQAYGVYTSVDNFAAPIATGTIANNSTWTLQSPAFTAVTGTTGGAVTFRLFGYNGAGSPAAGTANWRIDDLKLTITTPAAPAFTTQPLPQTATVGTNVTFTVVATGAPAPTLQWRKGSSDLANGGVVSGATTATLTLTNITVTDVGSYSCVATNSVSAVPSNPVALTVNPAPATVTLGGLGAVYDGTPKSVTATTVPASLPVTITYNGSGAAPTAAGGYAVVATVVNPNYTGTASGTLIIAKAPVAIALGALNATYDGAPKPVTVTTVPAALALTVTYGGAATAPSAVGSYSVIANVNDANYAGAAIGTLTIAKATALITLGALNATYDGTAKPVTVTTVPAGLALTVTYGGLATAPLAVGSYAVSASVNDANYAGAANGTLTIAKAAAAISLGALNATYDGAPKPVTVTTVPAGLAVTVTYGGAATVPSAVGSYSVSANVNDANYAGSASGTLTIAKVAQTITFAALADKLTSSAPFALGATASSALPVTFSIVSGPATVSGSTLTLAGTAGTVVVRAAQAGNENFAAATFVDQSFNVTAATVAPTITTQPVAPIATAGGTASFSVVASGTPAPTYQWRKNGTAIPGATAATLLLNNVQAADAASYDVVVTNSAGSVTSSAVTLAVIRRNFGGFYFGTLGGGGSFAIFVRPDHTGVFLGFAPGTGVAYVSRAITVDDSGHFRFTTTTSSTATGIAAELTPPRAAAEVVFDGTINADGVVSGGAVGNAALSLAATKSSATGATAALAGFYAAGASNTSAQALTIVGPAGQAYVLTQSSTVVDAGVGTVDATGKISVTTANSQTVSATVSAGMSSVNATITDSRGRATSYAGVADGSAAAAQQRLVNISTRARAGSAADVEIAGFVITGTEPKSVLIRAAGPALDAFGVAGALRAPKLELFRGGALVATNTGWTAAANAADISAAAVRAGAFAFAAGSADSAVFTTLAPGAYSAVVSSANGLPGVGLVEVYDLSAAVLGQRLINISTRAAVGANEQTLIAGVVVGGSVPKRVLIRAAGPGLAQFGLTGVLARPQLTLFAGSTVIAQNAGWGAPAADAAVIGQAGLDAGAFAFAAGSADAALVVNLAPGAYTAQVTGVGGATGIALVEIYELP